jgi:hypothetical protein
MWAVPYAAMTAGAILLVAVGFVLDIPTASTGTQVGFGLTALVACGVALGG